MRLPLILIAFAATLLPGCANDLVMDLGEGDSIRLVGMGDSFDCDDPAYADVKKVVAFNLVFADGTTQRLCVREGSRPTIQEPPKADHN
jgi:hypothetical protein